MIFKIALLCVYLVLVAGRPQEEAKVQLQPSSSTQVIPIISQTESVDPNGNFNYSYETGNGIKVQESGTLKHVTGLRARGNFAPDDDTPDEDDILVQRGSFSYTAPDGTVISLRYIADENGFQPTGDHLPTIPPIFRYLQQNITEQQQQPLAQRQLISAEQQQQPQQQPQQSEEQPLTHQTEEPLQQNEPQTDQGPNAAQLPN